MKLIIVALPRTGSTTLYRACCCHKDANGIYEPFRAGLTIDRPNGHLFEYRDRPACISKSSKFNIIKNIDHHLSYRFNKKFAQRYPTVTLTRENFLKEAVSIQIASQTNSWHPNEKDNISEETARELEQMFPNGVPKVDIANIEISHVQIDKLLKSLKRRAQRLQMLSPARHFTYESIYEKSTDEQLSIVRSLLQYGRFDPSLLDEEKVKKLFERGRYYKEESYHKIKGLDEINRTFGNEENGFLW